MYYITIKNGLLEPKHYKSMGQSVWLFMWLLDKMTSISEEGIGKVLGGRPIKYEEVNESLGISHRTYDRYVETLERAGYINTTRTPYGLRFEVNKTVKVFGKQRDTSKVAHPVTPNVAERYVKSGASVGENGVSNKTIQLDNTKTKSGSALEEPAAPDGPGYKTFQNMRHQFATRQP